MKNRKSKKKSRMRKGKPAGSPVKMEFMAGQRKLVFHGPCLEVLAVCQAACCANPWNVELTREEYQSGRYTGEAFCRLFLQECREHAGDCIHRAYRLKKKQNGECVLLGPDRRCGIYETRPEVCRKFSCSNGWVLERVAAAAGAAQPDETIDDETIFIPHPLHRFLGLSIVKPASEVVFVTQAIGSCGKWYTRCPFDHPAINDSLLLTLIELFGHKVPLRDIRERFSAKTGVPIDAGELRGIARLLAGHRILLDSRKLHYLFQEQTKVDDPS